MGRMMPMLKSEIENNLLTEQQFIQLFNLFKANIVRSRRTITVVFLRVYNQVVIPKEDIVLMEDKLRAFFQSKMRETDVLYKIPASKTWSLLLTDSGEREATAFLKRLFRDVKNKKTFSFHPYHLELSASIVEIGNSEVVFKEVFESGQLALMNSVSRGPFEIEYEEKYKKKAMETIKVSVLEDNEIFQGVLRHSLENLSVEHFYLDIRTFQDGYEFLESDWYMSSHTHILIMNDILPRKNGLDVLHTIRQMPNNKKFIVFMMTKRQSEADMIYASEKGVDEYLIKPFNLRLFEAQLKRNLDRLWS